MPIFSLLPFAKPVFDIAQNLLSKRKKPKREDFVQSTDFIKRFIANLRSRGSSSEVQNLLLQPELRRIGAEGRSAFRDIQSSFARVGAPEGAIAEARTGIARTTIQGISEATGKARALQLQENRRLEDRIDRALLQEGSIQSRGDLAFRRAQTGFEENARQRKIGLLGSFASLAVAGLDQFGKSKSLKDSLLNRAKSEGVLPPEAKFEDLQQAGLEQFGIEPGTGEAGKETLRGLVGLRDISTKIATSFQQEFGEFDPGIINQAIGSAGLNPATLKSGDFNKISREIKKLQLSNFKNLLQSPDLDTIFESRAVTGIDKQQFNKLLTSIKKATGQELSTVRREALDIFTSVKPPEEIVSELNSLLSGEISDTDSKSVLSLLGKARTIQSQAGAAGRREKGKRVDLTQGASRVSEILTDITNTDLFPDEVTVGQNRRIGGVSDAKTEINDILQKIQRDKKITSEEINNFQLALQTLSQRANIPSSGFKIFGPDGNEVFVSGDNSERAKLVLLNNLRNKFFRILDLLDITIQTEEDTSGLSDSDLLNQFKLLLGGNQ